LIELLFMGLKIGMPRGRGRIVDPDVRQRASRAMLIRGTIYGSALFSFLLVPALRLHREETLQPRPGHVAPLHYSSSSASGRDH